MAKSSLPLVSYASSSEESDAEENEPVGKRKQENISDEEPNQKKRPKTHLPLPESIRQLGANDESHIKDEPSGHGGRIRSFPHKEGNWATLVYIPYDPEEEFFRLQKELFLCLRPLDFQPMEDYHVSLSRTVTIRHHWIQTLVDSLRKGLGSTESCGLEIEGVKVYTNDENTRSFLALDVTSGSDDLQEYVSVVDSCFREYKLQEYYKDFFDSFFSHSMLVKNADYEMFCTKEQQTLFAANLIQHLMAPGHTNMEIDSSLTEGYGELDVRRRRVVCIMQCVSSVRKLFLVNTLEAIAWQSGPAFQSMKLTTKPPSFHLSIGWCLGDITSQIDDNKQTKLKETLKKCLADEPELQFFFVDSVRCKTGNKEFHFPLTDT